MNLIEQLCRNEWTWSFALAFAAVGFGGAYIRKYWYPRRLRLGPNHVVVITGCDSGLGYSLGLHCKRYRITVIASVLREDSPGALDLKQMGHRVLQLDVTNRDSVKKFAQTIQEILSDEGLELYALVNNAGKMVFGEFEWQLDEQVRQQMEVNVLGTMSVTRELIPLLRHFSGRIINVTSHCALAQLPGLSVYGASKAALHAWSNALRIELGKLGVNVVMFIPGNFLGQSNIMAEQERYFEEMRSGMKAETWNLYSQYFEQYKNHLSSLSKINGYRPIENSKLYETFDKALTHANPSPIYKCEPWRYKLYHCLFRLAPIRARDRLIERFTQLPRWTAATIDRHRRLNSS